MTSTPGGRPIVTLFPESPALVVAAIDALPAQARRTLADTATSPGARSVWRALALLLFDAPSEAAVRALGDQLIDLGDAALRSWTDAMWRAGSRHRREGDARAAEFFHTLTVLGAEARDARRLVRAGGEDLSAEVDGVRVAGVEFGPDDEPPGDPAQAAADQAEALRVHGERFARRRDPLG